MADSSHTRLAHPGELGVLAHDVPLWTLFIAFLKVSTRAWGGGSGTIYTMHRELTQRGWITSGQFALDFGLSRVVPGINLLALAVIVGYRLNGPLGSIVCTVGLMLPASVITLLLTVGFAELTSNPIGGSMVQGAVPVTAALTFALAYENAAGVMPWRERRVAALMAAAMLATFLLVVLLHLSVAVMIIAGAVAGVLFFRPPEGRAKG